MRLSTQIRVWPLWLLVISIGLTSPLRAAARPPRISVATDPSASIAEQYLLAAANQERLAAGLGPLRRDPLLVQAASAHALAMAAHGTISHQFGGEPELSARCAAAGVRFSVISENVGEADTALTLHDMWMRSKGHRENLLDPAIDVAGIGVISRGGQLYAVEDFAKSVQTLTLDEQETTVGNLIARINLRGGMQLLTSDPATLAAARETCSMATGYAGDLRPGFIVRYTSSDLHTLPDALTTRMASGQFRQAAVGACTPPGTGPFTSYALAVLLYP